MLVAFVYDHSPSNIGSNVQVRVRYYHYKLHNAYRIHKLDQIKSDVLLHKKTISIHLPDFLLEVISLVGLENLLIVSGEGVSFAVVLALLLHSDGSEYVHSKYRAEIFP